MGFMLHVVNSVSDEVKPYSYRGEDCMDVFCAKVNEIRDEIVDKMDDPLPMEKLTHEERKTISRM